MSKKIQISILFLILSFSVFSQSVTIGEYGGWLESAYVTWIVADSADSYNVYYSGNGIDNQQIDDQLIRYYGTYYRADILGLAAGSYTINVVPVVSGIEGTGAETGTITVEAHDRTGFAFSNNRMPGAYKADGTVKSNAVILYITENTKDIIALEVSGANSNPCVGLETILEGFKKGKDNRPLIVRLIGQITDYDYMSKGDIVIENNNNESSYITFEGVGDDAVADGWGVRVKNASNIEIRNIGFMNVNSDEGDDLGLQQNNEYVWVHHCDMFYGDAGGDSDQAKGDGALDCKKSTYVTFSYNHFWDTGKSNLLGLNEDTTEGLYITYHHNWYDHSDSRHPRVRFYSAHIYNNYYDGIAKYGVGSTEGSSVFVEGNYFRNCKYPMLISMQGSDVYDSSTGSNDYSDMPTFSKEDGGCIKAYNNEMTGQRRFIAYGSDDYSESTVDFDAYVATTRDEEVPATVVSVYGSNTYNNFDTDATLIYNYIAESPEDAKETVVNYAGRMNGGDFNWTFDNSTDDASYAVNAELKTALTGYTSSLVSVQGDSVSSGEGTTPADTTNTEPNEEDMIHNFTTMGTTSTFYTISGNLSDSKGTETYNGLTLTQCLKIESSTSILFTSTQEGTFTLVFNYTFSGDIKINGISYSVSSGMLTLTLDAGSYEITKDDVANLYYMSLVYSSNSVETLGNREFEIYPNPTNGILNISSDVEVDKVEVYSSLGQFIVCNTMENNCIDVGNLKRGNYAIRVYTVSGVYTRRFVKL